MKIAIIGQKGIPTIFGGVERYVEEISTRLAKKKDNEVFVYARSYYSPRNIKKFKGVNIIHLPYINTKHLDAISHVFLSSLHAIFILKADVFHYQAIGPALCMIIPKIFRSKAKVVFTFHCRDYFHKKWGFFARFMLKIGEMSGCYFSDEIIPTDKEVEKYIKNKYNIKTNFIPHGISEKSKREANEIKKFGLEKDNYILWVGRLIPHKGVCCLINAYKKINTDKKLVIVGPSFYTKNYEEELKKISESNKNIIFLGVRHGKILEELFSNAYIFVNPSEQEGNPLVLTESAGFGNCILLSDIKVHKEVFKDLPFFFKSKNTKDLLNKLEFLLKNPKIVRERGSKISDYAKEKYSWDKTVDEIEARYKNNYNYNYNN